MLKAGFARVDVTPPLGTYVAGYFQDRYAKGVLDPIYLNAVAVSDENETVVIITADFLNMSATFADELRAHIAKRTGIPANHLMISCLHQHTSAVLREGGISSALADEGYRSVLVRKFGDVAEMALADCSEATLSRGEGETAEPLSFIRRHVLKDGTYQTNTPKNRWDEIVRPCDDADNTVRLLRFSRKEGNDIAFVNFSTHPDVIGGELLSADWPGFVRRFVENDLEGVSCLLINGAQGDSNHINAIGQVYNKGYAYSRHMGRVIADVVLQKWDQTIPCEDVVIHADVTNVYNRTRTDGEERYDECVKLIEEYNRLGKDFPHPFNKVLEARRILGIRNAMIYRRLPITVVSLGQVALVGFGGEAFTHYATAVREACPDRYIIAACCTNGGEGYLPTEAAFSEGGYESVVSQFTPTLERECVAAAAELLGKM